MHLIIFYSNFQQPLEEKNNKKKTGNNIICYIFTLECKEKILDSMLKKTFIFLGNWSCLITIKFVLGQKTKLLK